MVTLKLIDFIKDSKPKTNANTGDKRNKSYVSRSSQTECVQYKQKQIQCVVLAHEVVLSVAGEKQSGKRQRELNISIEFRT